MKPAKGHERLAKVFARLRPRAGGLRRGGPPAEAEEGAAVHRVEKTWHQEERPSLWHLLVEAGMIVFSILLALGIESWREHRAHERLAATALHNIRAEITQNRDALRSKIPEHKAIEKYLGEVEERLARREVVEISTTYRPATLLSSAWETSKSTQALVYVDFQKVERLSRLYSGHLWVQRMENNWLSLTGNPTFRSKENFPEYVHSLRETMRDLARIEEELAAGCDQILATTDFDKG